MARVEVHGADVSEGKIEQLRVGMHNLPARTIDRATAMSWLKDGHSFITRSGAALQLVEVINGGDEPSWYIRIDNAASTEDAVGDLPAVNKAGV